MNAEPNANPDTPASEPALAEDELMALAEGLERLPLDEAEWVARLFRECQRARAAEAQLRAQGCDAAQELASLDADIAQIVLDAAEWLRTLWNVGYMGAAHFPAEPRSDFPSVEVEDVLKSALLSRIRQGKRPLPFPPPTRHGVPWHEVVEASGRFAVEATVVRDEDGTPLAAAIDGCSDWQIVEEVAAGREYLVQHAGKGPLYRLVLAPEAATLCREPPKWTRQIRAQERGGVRSFILEWPRPDGKPQSIPLRAATWERAESEAMHWIATRHPQMYGQVSFISGPDAEKS